jgi:hypothetical protein
MNITDHTAMDGSANSAPFEENITSATTLIG